MGLQIDLTKLFVFAPSSTVEKAERDLHKVSAVPEAGQLWAAHVGLQEGLGRSQRRDARSGSQGSWSGKDPVSSWRLHGEPWDHGLSWIVRLTDWKVIEHRFYFFMKKAFSYFKKLYKLLSEVKLEVETVIKTGRQIVQKQQTENPKAMDEQLTALKLLYNDLGAQVNMTSSSCTSCFQSMQATHLTPRRIFFFNRWRRASRTWKKLCLCLRSSRRRAPPCKSGWPPVTLSCSRRTAAEKCRLTSMRRLGGPMWVTCKNELTCTILKLTNRWSYTPASENRCNTSESSLCVYLENTDSYMMGKTFLQESVFRKWSIYRTYPWLKEPVLFVSDFFQLFSTCIYFLASHLN